MKDSYTPNPRVGSTGSYLGNLPCFIHRRSRRFVEVRVYNVRGCAAVIEESGVSRNPFHQHGISTDLPFAPACGAGDPDRLPVPHRAKTAPWVVWPRGVTKVLHRRRGEWRAGPSEVSSFEGIPLEEVAGAPPVERNDRLRPRRRTTATIKPCYSRVRTRCTFQISRTCPETLSATGWDSTNIVPWRGRRGGAQPAH